VCNKTDHAGDAGDETFKENNAVAPFNFGLGLFELCSSTAALLGFGGGVGGGRTELLVLLHKLRLFSLPRL
jgi:hypothetical protein